MDSTPNGRLLENFRLSHFLHPRCKAAWLGLALVLVATCGWSNNLSITNVSLLNANLGVADIQFDVSVDNSWRSTWVEAGGGITVTNWDAVWLFLKFRTAGGIWKHGLLAPTGHQVPAGISLTAGTNSDGRIVGAFIYRNADGNGSLNLKGLKLKWNYEASNLAGTNAVDVSVHGIEMVYVTPGSFYLGTGGTEINHFYTGTNNQPYLVSSENAIPVNVDDSSLRYENGDPSVSGDMSGPIPAAFPKGFRGFFCMKYEISQGQYTDFLNFLEPGLARGYAPNLFRYRNTIDYNGTNYFTDTPNWGCGHLGYSDTFTYLDWAALRPMTELEFEKACRGPVSPVINEFAWGNTYLTYLTSFVGTDGTGTETAAPSDANCMAGNNIGGPARVGIFATASSNRQAAGAGYFGAMDLSGNLSELTVTVGSPSGRGFRGENGDGNEYTPVPSWPAYPGIGWRGESWQGSSSGLCISARTRAAASNADRNPTFGGRGVRTVW